jgi:hypothetical protein
MNTKYQYDIGFSFLAEDELIASRIVDELSKNFKVFFFPTNQKEIAAKDGVDTFSEVFSRKTRLNLVLYREKWGNTKWTRIEEAAIKTRIFDGDGWDSLFFIKLDDHEIPNWINSTYIYADFNKFTFEELIGAIKYRIQERGGVSSEETISNILERDKRNQKIKQEISAFLEGEQGLHNANSEVQNLLSLLEIRHEELKNTAESISVGPLLKDSKKVSFPMGGIHLHFIWKPFYSNSLDNSHLEIILYPYFEKSGKGKSFFYSFTMNNLKQIGWKNNPNHDFITSEDLIDFWIKEHLKLAIERR